MVPPRSVPRSLRIAVAAVILTALSAPVAAPQPAQPLVTVWETEGRVIAAGTGTQSEPVACSDGEGGAYIAWTRTRPNFPREIYAVHIDVHGNVAPGWAPGGNLIRTDPVALTTQGNPDDDPDPDVGAAQLLIVPDHTGGAILAWRSNQLFATRLVSAAPRHPSWPANGLQVTIGPAATAPDLVADRTGGAFFSWNDYSRLGQIFVLRRTGEGAVAPGWDPGGRALGSSGTTFLSFAMVPDGVGGAYVSFGGYPEIDHVTPAGSVSVVAQLGGYADILRPFPDSRGGTILAYATGAEEIRIAGVSPTGLQWTGSLGADASRVGGVVPSEGLGNLIAWEKRSGIDRNLHIRKFDATGQTPAGWPPDGYVVSDGFSLQIDTRMITDGAGGAVLAWRDVTSSIAKITVQHVASDGGIPTGTEDGARLCCAGPGLRDRISLIPSLERSAFVVWQDTRADGGDIYAQRIVWDAPVSVAWSVSHTEAQPGRVLVRWYATEGGSEALIQRSLLGEDWREVGRAVPDGSGLIEFEDRAVVAGTSYGYRLIAHGVPVGEVWVEVPVARLELSAVTPNPSDAPLRVSFTLPHNRDARLELFDVSGRRVDSRAVGALGAGRHVVELGGNRLRPGVYLVRLGQSGNSQFMRVTVMR